MSSSMSGDVWVTTTDKKVNINGKVLDKPGRGNTQTIINGKIFINGFQYKDGVFKRTLASIWYSIF